MSKMSHLDGRKYFIIKHDLESFKLLPGFIWKTDILPPKMPRGFRLVEPGDVWIEFAHVRDERTREHCSLVTGFRRCVQAATYRRVPEGPRYPETDWVEKGFAWMIEGEDFGEQPRCDVTIPPLQKLLDKDLFGRKTITEISAEEFNKIRAETSRLELPRDKIPLLGREPRCEQELLAIVIAGLDRLGIDRILQVQVHFPDLLAVIDGKEVWLELEVFSLDFQSHGHIEQLRQISNGDFRGRREAKRIDSDDDRPVAILCWADDDWKTELKASVRGLNIFELQYSLREGEKLTLS